MQLCQRLEQILQQLRPAFRREATFQWFVLLLWGVMLNSQPPAVTSYINALGLTQGHYLQALHWFESRAFSVKTLTQYWSQWLTQQEYVYRIKGQRVYVGDGIKVAKEGRKMPGVKRLHQESENVSKPEWLRGHYFSALTILMGKGLACFAVPVGLRLHDGIKAKATSQKTRTRKTQVKTTLVTKMANLCTSYVEAGSYVILDAYFACESVLQHFRTKGLHLITRVRSSTVAYAPFSRVPTLKGRGRPRLWGSAIKLQSLFAEIDDFLETSVWLYGRQVTVLYQCYEFYWDSPHQPVQFVLTQLPNQRQLILLSTDLSLSGPEIIAAYGLRFKIEVTFRQLIHLLGGFAYRFWLKGLTTLPTWPGNLILSDYSQTMQTQIARKVEAFERFVALNAIALGLLQILSLELPQVIWGHFPRWLRTLPAHGYPSERIAQLALQNQAQMIFPHNPPSLLLPKFLATKLDPPPSPDVATFAA